MNAGEARSAAQDQEWLRDLRGYILACIGDADGQRAVERHRMLTLTAGQVQCLAEGLGLLNAAIGDDDADERDQAPSRDQLREELMRCGALAISDRADGCIPKTRALQIREIAYRMCWPKAAESV